MKDKRNEELSSFWDLSDLIPPKKSGRPPVHASSIEAVDVFSEETQKHIVADNKNIPQLRPEIKESPQPENVYTSEEGLIRKVEIFPWRSNYQVYEQFRRDAKKLYGVTGQPCRMEPFFSFVPQYSQLTRAQMNTYLYWREEVRNGRFPNIDFSYLKLYLFECINLSDVLNPTDFFEKICSVWLAYRPVFAQLDPMISEWLTDYCLIHHVTPPEQLSTILTQIERQCSLKELFICKRAGDESVYIDAVLTFCSTYDYHSSRYAEGEMLSRMEKHIPAVLRCVISSQVSDVFKQGPIQVTKEREAYAHALCAYALKKRIRVVYDALSHSYEMKLLVTEIVKYAENRLRSFSGIKSRLTVHYLSDPIKAVIDTYFDRELPKKQKVTVTEGPEKEDYWKLYDSEKKPISLGNAEQIEALSWQTTRKLVETFSEDAESGLDKLTYQIPEDKDSTPISELKVVEPENASNDLNNSNSQTTPFAPNEIEYICAYIGENTESIYAIRKNLKEPEDALIDRINEKAVTEYGDILFEETDNGYALIEDYRTIAEDLKQHYGKQ